MVYAGDKVTDSVRPNIIFVLADDLGYGDLGCFGQKRIETPHIDRLAAEGMVFSNYYTGSPVSAAARCVLLTGKHSGHCASGGMMKLRNVVEYGIFLRLSAIQP